MKLRSPNLITKPNVQMFHDESWKPVYFGVKRSKVNCQGHNVSVGLHAERRNADAAAYVSYAGFSQL